jgi:hypothetical protein
MTPWIRRLAAVITVLVLVAPWCCCLAASPAPEPVKHSCCDKAANSQAPQHKCDCNGQTRVKLDVPPTVLQAPVLMALEKLPMWAAPLLEVDSLMSRTVASVPSVAFDDLAPPGPRVHLRCHILLI